MNTRPLLKLLPGKKARHRMFATLCCVAALAALPASSLLLGELVEGYIRRQYKYCTTRVSLRRIEPAGLTRLKGKAVYLLEAEGEVTRVKAGEPRAGEEIAFLDSAGREMGKAFRPLVETSDVYSDSRGGCRPQEDSRLVTDDSALPVTVLYFHQDYFTYGKAGFPLRKRSWKRCVLALSDTTALPAGVRTRNRKGRIITGTVDNTPLRCRLLLNPRVVSSWNEALKAGRSE